MYLLNISACVIAVSKKTLEKLKYKGLKLPGMLPVPVVIIILVFYKFNLTFG